MTEINDTTPLMESSNQDKLSECGDYYNNNFDNSTLCATHCKDFINLVNLKFYVLVGTIAMVFFSVGFFAGNYNAEQRNKNPQ